MTGIIEWGQKSKPKKICRASNKTPPKIPGPKINPQKSRAEFRALIYSMAVQRDLCDLLSFYS